MVLPLQVVLLAHLVIEVFLLSSAAAAAVVVEVEEVMVVGTELRVEVAEVEQFAHQLAVEFA